MSTPPEAKLVEVEVVDGEYVAGRGTKRVIWFVRQGKDWRGVMHCPGAQSAELESGPGTVWESQLRVPLAPGTEVMKVTVSPRPEPPRSALDYLLAPTLHPKKATSRRYFVVTSRGLLEPLPDAPSAKGPEPAPRG